MRRLLYRVMVLNLTLFMVGALALILSRNLIAPEQTPYHAIRVSLGLALELEDPPAEVQARVERLHAAVGARLSIYAPSGALIASSVDPPLPDTERDWGVFGGYHDVHDETGRLIARVISEPPIKRFARQTSHDLLLAWLVVCGLTVFVSIRATQRLAEPLLAVEDAARRLGEGELDARVKLPALGGDPVIAELGAAFNLMAERLGLSLRSQRELVANVSHEFRTPLARMRVVSEMLAEGDDVRELLPELDTDIAELDRLVERVLEAAVFEREAARAARRGASLSSRERISAAELVERVAARFELAHPERSLERADTDPCAGLEVEVELNSLLRAFDNLLENAHRYSAAESAITLRTACEGGQLRVEIVDRGVGIGAEDLPLIFNPFFRADRSRARHTGGLGLGLATSRGIVEAQGGTLSVESELERGSCFCVALPLSAQRC